MKRAALLIAVVSLATALPQMANAQSTPDDQGVFYVFIALRAGLNDGIQICSDHDFRDSREAYGFARTLEPAFGIPGLQPSYDPSNATDCVDLITSHPLSRPGPRPHERSFHFDPGPVGELADKSFKLDVTEIEICTPELSTRVTNSNDLEVYRGDCDRPFQQTYDYVPFIDAPGPIDISFRATPGSLLRGLLGVVLFWTLVAGVLALLAHVFGKRGWRFFANHRIVAWTMDVILMLGIVFCWLFIAPYWTNWIPSLQMYAHIGVAGEITMLIVPTIGIPVAMVAGPVAATRQTNPKISSKPENTAVGSASIPRLEITGMWDARSVLIIMVGLVPAIAFVILLNGGHGGLRLHLFVLVLAALYLFGDVLWLRLRLWAGHAEDRTSKFTLPRSELRGLGAHVMGGYVTRGPLVADVLVNRGPRLSAVVLSGRTLLVWTKIEDQAPAVISGAAIDSVGVGSEMALVPILILAGVFGNTPGIRVWPGIYIIAGSLGALFFARLGLSASRRARLMRAAARSPRSSSYLKGLLLRRWIAARVASPKRPMKPKFFASRQPSRKIWKAALRSANRFAARANIPPERVQGIVQEVMATDLG